jgi:hypothetical protein
MKKVTFDTVNTVNIQEITNSSIVGIIFPTSPDKHWVMEINSKYVGMNIGRTDLSGLWTRPSVQAYCLSAKEQGAKIFVFDSEEELTKWLIS